MVLLLEVVKLNGDDISLGYFFPPVHTSLSLFFMRFRIFEVVQGVSD